MILAIHSRGKKNRADSRARCRDILEIDADSVTIPGVGNVSRTRFPACCNIQSIRTEFQELFFTYRYRSTASACKCV